MFRFDQPLETSDNIEMRIREIGMHRRSGGSRDRGLIMSNDDNQAYLLSGRHLENKWCRIYCFSGSLAGYLSSG